MTRSTASRVLDPERARCAVDLQLSPLSRAIFERPPTTTQRRRVPRACDGDTVGGRICRREGESKVK